MKSKDAKNTIQDRLTLLLSIVAIIAMALIGTFMLQAEKLEQTVILTPEGEVAEPKSEELSEKIDDTNTRININTATKAELMLLDGIGDKKADAIIAYREETPFVTPEDLLKVHGIGEGVMKQIRDRVCVE